MCIRRRAAALLLVASGCLQLACRAQVTTITIGSTPLRTGVQRFGINLSGQTYYDSGQMLRNLVSSNPGFEGEMWQSVLRCKTFARGVCTDDNPYTVWPEHFLDGARFEVLTGAAAGASGTVSMSMAARPPAGFGLVLTGSRALPAAGDFIVVRMEKPGGADAGWWMAEDGGATISTELHDLSPHTAGRQALRMRCDRSRPARAGEFLLRHACGPLVCADAWHVPDFVSGQAAFRRSRHAREVGAHWRAHVFR